MQNIVEMIKEQISCKDFLKKSENGDRNADGGFICPACHSGTGTHKTGAVHYYAESKTWHCHSCGERGDVIDLFALLNSLDNTAAINALAKRINPAKTNSQSTKSNTENTTKNNGKQTRQNYSSFLLSAQEKLPQTEYRRGISEKTLKKFRVGFDPHWKHPQRPKMLERPSLIVPYDDYSYLARDTRENLNEEQKKYKIVKVGTNPPFFNQNALWECGEPLFITEGEFDALSIEDSGGCALALGSVKNIKKFASLCAENPPKRPLVISLDNDNSGYTASSNLLSSLRSQGILCIEANISGSEKDPNDLLQKDREALAKNIQDALFEIRLALEDEINPHLAFSAFFKFEELSLQKREGIQTGLRDLDNLLDGGFYSGLSIIGAVSSFGKTTLALQIADNMAMQGFYPLIFSLEMSKYELIAKSISRISYYESLEKYGNTGYARTTRQVLYRGNYTISNTEQALLDASFQKFRNEIAVKLSIVEGNMDMDVRKIRQIIQSYIYQNMKPVVFIDYLQIIAPVNDKYTDKQNTDKTVTELKRISRDFDLPIIAISSFNRANYREDARMEAFKESGNIEYSSDLLIAMQYVHESRGGNEQERKQQQNKIEIENNRKAANGEALDMELKILKNRNGRRGEVHLSFYPMFNVFTKSTNYPKNNNPKFYNMPK